MFKRINNIEEKLLYTLVWAVVFLIPILDFLMLPVGELHLVELLLAWLKISPFFFIFLINTLILLPRFALKRRYIEYIVLLFAAIISTFGIIELFDSAIMGEVYLVDIHGEKVTGSLLFTYLDFFWNSLLSLAMCSASYAIKMVYVSRENEKQLAELNRRRVEAEMEQLRHQINPHFFMNTLNNIHALIDIDSHQAKDAIIELSKMFRHIVYKSDGKQIRLYDDLRFVESYIALMKLRYESQLTILFNYPKGLEEDIFVPPLILVIFVENAFKHGVRGNSSSYINIDLTLRGNRLLYRVENSVANRRSSEHGIGLDNLRKRLELLFGKRYKLNINSNTTRYIVELDIPVGYEN